MRKPKPAPDRRGRAIKLTPNQMDVWDYIDTTEEEKAMMYEGSTDDAYAERILDAQIAEAEKVTDEP